MLNQLLNSSCSPNHSYAVPNVPAHHHSQVLCAMTYKKLCAHEASNHHKIDIQQIPIILPLKMAREHSQHTQALADLEKQQRRETPKNKNSARAARAKRNAACHILCMTKGPKILLVAWLCMRKCPTERNRLFLAAKHCHVVCTPAHTTH